MTLELQAHAAPSDWYFNPLAVCACQGDRVSAYLVGRKRVRRTIRGTVRGRAKLAPLRYFLPLMPKQMKAPSETSSTSAERGAVYRVVNFMAANGVSLDVLAKALGHNVVPIPESLRPTVKFEDAFRDPDTGEICRRGGPWKMWVRKRLEIGIGFSDLVIEKERLAFLFQALCHHDAESAR